MLFIPDPSALATDGSYYLGEAFPISLATEGYLSPVAFVPPYPPRPILRYVTITGNIAYFSGFPDARREVLVGPVIGLTGTIMSPVIVDSVILNTEQLSVITAPNGDFSFTMPSNVTFLFSIPGANVETTCTAPSGSGIISIVNILENT